MIDPVESLQQLPDRILFSKVSASANDFIVIDNRAGVFSDTVSLLAQRLCARRYSIGADGLILIENSNKASVRVRFFNPDGGEFNTCGNGGRCAARFAHLSVITGRRMTIETNAGVIDADVIGNSVKIKFVAPSRVQLYVPVTLDSRVIKGHVVRLGDPHFIVFATNLRKHAIVPFARKLRYHEAFAPEGVNVHLLEPVSRNSVKIRSYERGVEDETLACGSGCISSAIALHASGMADPPITFEPQSKIPLIVHFQKGGKYQDLYLEGDARLVYRGELTKEALFGFLGQP
ncbi:MAG TPA: diaminopimelate epimerase [Acidobacteriota bacterium]|nr:diaminopimelate epimerase [Acidobacteriota bacterium]